MHIWTAFAHHRDTQMLSKHGDDTGR